MGVPKGYKFGPRKSRLDNELPYIIEGVKIVNGVSSRFKAQVTACSEGYALAKFKAQSVQPTQPGGEKCNVVLRDVTVRKAK